MTLATVILLAVAGLVAFIWLYAWGLCRAAREPTEYDRRMEAHDMRLDDIARGSGRR